MKITKPNDILVATINNPNSSTYDLMSIGLTPENTSFFPDKDTYKSSNYIKDIFKTEDGKFDDVSFDNFYNLASYHYQNMSDEVYLKSLDEVEYSPFDITRPKEAKTFKVGVKFEKEINPFRQLYSRTGINSIDESPFSLREIAQQEKIYDPDTDTWSDKSANDISLLKKLFGETLVYAQWDEDGTHVDPSSQRVIKHKKGDWKVNDRGNLYIEKLAGREVYGKQIVNPMDLLTTDGSVLNQLDFFDSDSKDKSITKTAFKVAFDIAPFLVPASLPFLGALKIPQVYGGIKAAVGLAAVMPTFFKSLDGILENNNTGGIANSFTAAEGYMSKFTTSSISDRGQKSLFTYEQMSQMVGDIFSQIYEQRAAASLSKLITRNKELKFSDKHKELITKINDGIIKDVMAGKIGWDKASEVANIAKSKIPELADFYNARSNLSRSFSLGYMALTSTGQIYGEALDAGYDRRVAGFASLAAAAGQYGIMMNNAMGTWFLDESTGYTTSSNRAMISKSIKGYLDDIQEHMKAIPTNPGKAKGGLATTFRNIKNKMYDIFTDPSELQNAMVKNAFVEGVEEVTEQMVLDATKGVFDTMSYLGLIKQKGSFGGFSNAFSREGLEEYVANFVGGLLGGAMFEFNRRKIEPWVSGEALPPDTKRSVYQLVANGQTEALIEEVKKQKNKLGNNYISALSNNDLPTEAAPGQSQADLIADMAISMIRNIDGIMKAKGLAVSDEDIVRHAMIDHLIIQDLENSKGDSSIGIEGIIVDDFRNAASEILRIESDIKRLSENKEKEEENKEEIKRLKEQSKLLEKRIEDIKEGKLAEDYFTQMLFYLSKDISEHWLNIDKETYTKIKYEKEYNDLEAKGLGITKEVIDKEWQNYIDSKDLRKSIEVATKAYLALEKEMNPSIAKYIDSGYIEERKKTISNLVDNLKTLKLFDVSTKESRDNTITHYIRTAKEVESLTGKRIIPWEVINTDVADKIIQEELLSSVDSKTGARSSVNIKYLEEEVKVGEDTIKRRDIIKNILNLTLSSLPPESLVYDMIVDRFNNNVLNYNSQLDRQISELESKITSSNSTELQTQILELENRKIEVTLETYEDSSFRQRQIFETDGNLIAKQNELQISQEEIDIITNSTKEELSSIMTSYSEILSDYANKNNIPNVESLSEEQKIEALSGVIALYNIVNRNNLISNILESESDDKFSEVEKIINDFIDRLINIQPKVEGYNDFKNNILSTLKKPDLFNVNNYAIEAVIKEIKQSKNLDRELFLEIQKMFSSLVSGIKNKYLKEIYFTDEDIFNLLENIEEIYPNIAEYVDSIVNEDEYEEIMPSYIREALHKSPDLESAALRLEQASTTLLELKRNNDKTLNKLVELKEIISNSDNFISNTIYDFLENFELSLEGNESIDKNTVFSVLKQEELSLFNSSDITNYIAEGLRDQHIQQAINTLKMAKSVVFGMQTTSIDLGDPYGFIASRQSFVKNNKLDSDIKSLKTISSDSATVMLSDLQRIESKLTFLKELAKDNSGKIFVEQEITRSRVNELSLKEWERLVKVGLEINGKSFLPNIEDILSSKDSVDKKLLKIEEALFERYKDSTLEEKLEVVRELIKEYKYVNSVDTLYKVDGSDRISKEMKELNKNDFLLGLISNIVINSRDFNNRLLNILNGTFNKSPFFTQELAAKIAYASIVNPELFSEVAKENKYLGAQVTDYITYVLGDAGTGKTTVIFKTLLMMLQNNNPNMSVWFAAPHKEQASKLHKEILEELDIATLDVKNSFDKNELFERLGIKEILNQINEENSDLITEEQNNLTLHLDKVTFKIPTDLPNIIFIDEITHFTAIELAVMNELTKRARISNGDIPGINMRILGAGDPTQNGAIYSKNNNLFYNVDWASGIFTPQLNITVRALNSQQRTNNDYLSALTKKAIANYSTSKDIPVVMNIIGSGVTLTNHISNNKLNGTLVVETETLPENIIGVLKNIISDNPNAKIGILNNSLEISDELKEALGKIGISESNYKVYTENTVQGSESDYFIFPSSLLTSENIVRSLRKLYTYTSRAKYGSIILKTGDIQNEDGTVVNLIPKPQGYSESIQPMLPEVVKADKEKRIQSLKDLLDPDFNIKYDNFKFIIGEVTIDEDQEDSIFKGEETISQEPEEETFIKPEDNFNYRAHTFYNDLNIEYENKRGKVLLYKNDSFYGLSYGISKWNTVGDREVIELTTQEFNKLVDDYVSTKYGIWGGILKGKPIKLPRGNDYLSNVLGSNYSGNLKTSIVLKKGTYNNSLNSPFAKQEDNISEHLATGDKYLNLFAKIEINPDNFHYVHLATMPKIETVQKFYDQYVTKNSKSAKAYSDFITNGGDEYEIDIKQLDIKTSTRALKTKVTENTLSNLQNIPGLRFFNGTKFTKTPSYNLFPTGEAGFNEFKNIYKRHTFGNQISDEKLKEMYFGRIREDGSKTPGYKGKPYVIVSFVEDFSQAQVLLLRSKARSLKDITESLKNPFNLTSPKSAKQIIKTSKEGSYERKRLHGFTDTLFSGSQVLDMLIDLAVDKPELFNSFFKTGAEALLVTEQKIKSWNVDNSIKEDFLTNYLGAISGVLEKDLLANITYAKAGSADPLRQVLTEIQISVKDYVDNNKSIDKKELRKKLLDIVKNKKVWFSRFWNLFSFKNQSDLIITFPDILPEIKSQYEGFSKVMNSMIEYWNDRGKIYFNTSITPEAKGTFVLNKTEWDNDNLYINRLPEGFYLSVDLSKEVTHRPTPNLEKKRLAQILSYTTYNGNPILSENSTDTVETLNKKIEKAVVIKEILEHNNNIKELGEVYFLQDLVSLDLNTLQEYKNELDNRKKKQISTEEAVILLKDISSKLEDSGSYKVLIVEALVEKLNFLIDNDKLVSDSRITKEDINVLESISNNIDFTIKFLDSFSNSQTEVSEILGLDPVYDDINTALSSLYWDQFFKVVRPDLSLESLSPTSLIIDLFNLCN